jgi:hypothetical protein
MWQCGIGSGLTAKSAQHLVIKAVKNFVFRALGQWAFQAIRPCKTSKMALWGVVSHVVVEGRRAPRLACLSLMRAPELSPLRVDADGQVEPSSRLSLQPHFAQNRPNPRRLGWEMSSIRH